MADEKKTKQINKNAIFVHHLLKEDKNEALSYFSKESIQKMSYGTEGLQIFFKEYGTAKKSILRKNIEVKGLFYKIYPMVTNLTICGIGSYATSSVIHDIMRPYGFIIDLYRTQETTEHDGCTTVFLANDYRIILDIPEVFANFNLRPVRLPNMPHKSFEVLFFCRLCRCNGHMQYQCPNTRKNSPPSFTRHRNMDVFKRMPSENSYSDVVIGENRMNSLESDSCVEKNANELREFSNQNYDSEKKTFRNDTSKSCFVKSTCSKSENCHYVHKIANNVNARKKHGRSNCCSTPVDDGEKYKDYNSSSKAQPPKILEKRSSFEGKKHRYYEYEKTSQAATSVEQSDKQTPVSIDKREKKKKRFEHVLSCLLPPKTDLGRTIKLIKIAFKSDPRDIPEEVESILQNILNHNRGLKHKNAGRETRVFLNWIAMVLSKMKPESFRSVQSHEKPCKNLKKERKHVQDGKSISEIPKQLASRKRKVVLSLGVTQAISMTAGELQPELLYNFLNQVRGRKKLIEVASVFTQNISALASQLLKVQSVYYKYVRKRGPEEDQDIRYIKRLRQRLLQQNRNTTGEYFQKEADMTKASIKSETDMTKLSVKTESDITGIFVKREADMTEVSVKEDIFMRQTSDKGDFVYKNFSSSFLK